MNREKLILIGIFFLLFNRPIKAQVNCIPLEGDRFKILNNGVNLRAQPNLNSEIVYKCLFKDNMSLECIQEGIENDFIKTKIKLNYFSNEDILKIKNCFDELIEQKADFVSDFKDFYVNVQNDNYLMSIFVFLKSQNSLKYLKNFNTFQDFKKMYFDINFNKYLELVLVDGSEVYVHISLIEQFSEWGAYQTGLSIEEYLEVIEWQANLSEEKYCSFNESTLYENLKIYIELLIEKDEPFLAIKEINKFEKYIKFDYYNFYLIYLKMLASYNDDNYQSAISIGSKLLNLYNTKISKESNMDSKWRIKDLYKINETYQIYIYSLVKLEKYNEAYLHSSKVLKDKNLQFTDYLIWHAGILLNLGRKNEACDIINQEYQKGNELAKMSLEYCK